MFGVIVYVDSVGVMAANRGSRAYSKVAPVTVGKEILIYEYVLAIAACV